MKDKKNTVKYLVLLLSLLLLGMCTLIFGNQDFSSRERRYLAKAPENFSLTHWTLKDDLETFLSDQLPVRNTLVGLNSLYQITLSGRTQLDALPMCGMIMEKPLKIDAEVLKTRTENMVKAGEKTDLPFHLMIVPSAGCTAFNQLPPLIRPLYQGERDAFSFLNEVPFVLPMDELLSSDPHKTYYLTDHHWTLSGALKGYESFCKARGLSPLPPESFSLLEFPGFLGSTFSRSGLPAFKKDTIYASQPENPISFTIDGEENSYDTLIFPEQAQSYDGYTLFMKGNHGFSVIENNQAPKGHLVVFKDSFANTLLPLLSAHYQKITAVDLRYFRGNSTDALLKAGPADEVLFLYSLDSLINDTALIKKLDH